MEKLHVHAEQTETIAFFGPEPPDSWSQSFCYGETSLAEAKKEQVRVRFRNDGGKPYLRAEAHLTYSVPRDDGCRVTFAWSDDKSANQTAAHTFSGADPAPWFVATGPRVAMHWVEFTVATP